MNGVNKRFITVGLLAWGFAGVPLAFVLMANWMYVYSLEQGKLPPPWSGIGLLAICLTSGLASVIKLPIWRGKRWLPISLASAIYLLVMGVALFALGFYVACHNGDCI